MHEHLIFALFEHSTRICEHVTSTFSKRQRKIPENCGKCAKHLRGYLRIYFPTSGGHKLQMKAKVINFLDEKLQKALKNSLMVLVPFNSCKVIQNVGICGKCCPGTAGSLYKFVWIGSEIVKKCTFLKLTCVRVFTKSSK